jgi:hypothetical protein
MKRVNFTLDEETMELLAQLASTYYDGNRSRTVRAALESLASHVGHDGWVISGYTPVRAGESTNCHQCGLSKNKGDLLYRPVFERGRGPVALPEIPEEEWFACADCVESA